MGKAMSLLFAKEGCDIIVSDLDIKGSGEVAAQVQALGRRSLAIKADISHSAEVNDMVARAIKKFGKIDILVNNAGSAGGDMWSQAMSGIVSLMGYPFPACDHVGGMLVAYAIMTALFVRERTGVGQAVNVNNLDAALYLQYSQFAEYLAGCEMPY
jgi:NAD(P)-dependent dehydrogenase (short-subunit alcohol dehydrogenase family)